MENDYSIALSGLTRLPPGRRGMRSLSQRAALSALFSILGKVRNGALRIRLPGGEERRFGAHDYRGPVAEIVVKDLRAIVRLLRGGDVGFAESFLEGQWETPDLNAVMVFALRSEQILREVTFGGRLARTFNRLYHWRRNNSRKGSMRNIAFHYDLGNAFYSAWLDAGMTYSSALFEHSAQPLVQAQDVKYRRIADLAELHPAHRVLEIGCGWGGFMEHAVARVGCRVDGITLSGEQLAYTRQRLQGAGIHGRATAVLADYRDTCGEYDAVVSIEMLEAVGEEHWPCYFQTLYNRLKPGGCAVIQVITISDERFPRYSKRTDFIQRYVFPGGMLPTTRILLQQAGRAGLHLDHQETFGSSYAHTLAIWRERFLEAWPKIAGLGYDQRMRRLWEYYLCYCETGFRAGTTDVGIYRFRKPR